MRRTRGQTSSRAAAWAWFWAALTVIVVCAVAGFMAQSRRVPAATAMGSSGFDLDSVPGPASPGRRAAAAHVPAAEAPPAGLKEFAPPRPQPGEPGGAEARLEDAVKSHAGFKALISSPAAYIVAKTHLGSPRRLGAFLADRGRIEGYLASPLVRAVLESPTLVRLVARPAVIRAFVGSPAMSDPGTVKALAESPLVQAVATAPGVRKNLEDPTFVNQVLLDPQTAAWLGRNPSALGALAQFGLAFGAAALPR